MNDLISVIVPIYNAAEYLNECIDSLLNQSYQKIEIILVNDGSSDGSELICLSYAEKHSDQIRYVKKENGGPMSARKEGISRASGLWIVFVDSDDTVKSNYIKNLALCSQNTDCVFSPIDKKHVTNGDLFSRDQFISLLLRRKICLGPVCKLYKKQLFDNFVFDIPNDLRNGEDFIMNLRFALNAKKFKQSVCFDYYYRPVTTSLVHIQRISIKAFNNFLQHVDISFERRKNKYSMLRFWHRILIYKYFIHAKIALRTRLKRLFH